MIYCFNMNIYTKLEKYYNEYYDKSTTLEQLKKLFDKNLKGKIYNVNNNFHGSEGHFVEKCLGIENNSKNEPDYKGWEIKLKSKKINFGDWNASGYLFKQDKYMKLFNNIPININRDDFMKFFGTYNIIKNRWAWSGKCIPKINTWNYNGTIMIIDKYSNIYILYSNEKDKRQINLPKLIIKQKFIILQYWKNEKIQKYIENKFNKNGFILFEKENNIYKNMLIGKNIDMKLFIYLLKNKEIIFDSGMYQGNSRHYSKFRASDKLFSKLIIEKYS